MRSPVPPSFADLARGLVGPVLAAGRLQLEIRARGIAPEYKADQSPVTEADRASEELLAAALSDVAPGVPVVGEEGVSAGAIPAIGDSFFLVDPLDGTREFLRGGDDFTVNVGLVRGGSPVFGIVYAPAKGWLFLTPAIGIVTEARFAPGADATYDTIDWQRARVRERVVGRLVAVTSRSHRVAEEDGFLDGLGVSERMQIGSSLKFCLLARGDADVYARFGPISEWDTAAGHAILVAAGGAVVPRDGGEWRYGNAAGGFLARPFVAWGSRPAQ